MGDSQRSSNEKLLFFKVIFFINNLFWYGRYENKKWHHRVCLIRPVRNMHFLNLKGQFENLTTGQVRSRSGQGQITTQVGQYAHPLERLDELSRVAWFACIYLHPVATLVKNGLRRHLTSGDLPWLPIVSYTQICTDGLSGHDPEKIGWFRSVYGKGEGFSNFPIGL